MSIAALVDGVLRARNVGREIAGGAIFRASEIGYCPRSTLLKARGAEPSRDTINEATLRRFEVGHMTAAWVGNLLSEAGMLVATEQPLHDPGWNLGGHADFIMRDGTSDTGGPLVGVELKSMQSRAFWHGAKSENGTVAQPHQFLQAATYALLAERTNLRFGGEAVGRWMVVSISKDDLTIAEDPVTEAHKAAAAARILLLNEHLSAGTLPGCECLTGWMWRYCGFYRGSEESIKRKKADGSCCEEAS